MGHRIVCISDTHLARPPVVPEGEFLVHGGDWCGEGPVSLLKAAGREQLRDFCLQLRAWKKLFRNVVVIAGNHDFIAEAEDSLTRDSIEETGAVYLNDSGVTIDGVSFWGSPIQPWFEDWAFNRQRGEEIRRHWDLIPENLDVLITHGPPYGILDQLHTGEHPSVGCEELLRAVQQKKPKIHVFGHIHEGYGRKVEGSTQFINASVLNENYELQNQPIVVTINSYPPL